MIRALRANKPSFREIRFEAGFNVVLADRTKESTRHDTRNGLGKSTLVEILHFCLGSQPRRQKGLLSPDLKGWEFTLDLIIDGQPVAVSRSVDEPAVVRVVADTSEWPLPESKAAPALLSVKTDLAVGEWVTVLGSLMYGLPSGGRRELYPSAARLAEPPHAKDGPAPSFRSLISYAMRRGREGFLNPFEHHRKQAEWDKQIHSAFLLGLAWEDARDWARLKERAKYLRDLRRAAKAGLSQMPSSSLGELEATKVRLERRVREDREALNAFRVHQQYRDIEKEANELTQQLHAAANEDVADRRVLAAYNQSTEAERGAGSTDVARLYRDAGVQLGEAVMRRLEEVQAFHKQVVENRRVFLRSEIQRLERLISQRESDVRRMSDRRADLMAVLETHGALDEYSRLERRHVDAVQQLSTIESQIAQVRELQRGQGEARLQQETLRQRAQLDYDARRDVRDRAIALFTLYSEALYGAPGNLIIDVTPEGFRFDVDIERAGSNGVENMKIFCYDLTIATLWANRRPSPNILVHDSTIFDGVDERQVALALELAASVASREGFQYICLLNSDAVPKGEFSPDFDLGPFVRRRLTDETEQGSLLGRRFEAASRASGGRGKNSVQTSFSAGPATTI